MNTQKISSTYELLEKRDIKDLNSVGYRLKHKKTGARIMLLENDDNNKVFYIGFRTPPFDSTGSPHILEHSVLCGSKKFPVKDPFVELAKGSLNTFLNAMTYPDKTVYPVASTNDKDFKNLVDVYMDAVLHPNIYEREEIFKQEGWHYELNSPFDPIEINGVVYNEMKGAYSSPDDVLSREINMSLFPDTQYAKESGGDPECIPDLTYEKFKEMHSKYYHPSNSYIYLYGDLDMAEMLTYLDREYLSSYEDSDIDSALKLQTPFTSPCYKERSYSVTEDEPLTENTYLSLNFVTGTNLDPELYIAFQVLEYALLDVPGAPLTQTLLDRGIGKDVDGSYDNSIYQSVFSVTVKNSDIDKKDEFVDTVKEVLSNEVHKGLDRQAILAALNFYEFRYREADFGPYPKGLMYGLQSLDSWLYDDDKPFIHIESNAVFKRLRELAETSYFEDLIKKYLLDNPFSSLVVLKPERGLTSKKEQAVSDKLKKYKESLSKEEIDKLIKDTKALKEYQDTPSTEEELLTIPLLRISDIGKKAEEYSNEAIKEDNVDYLFHDVFTNGISYLTFAFDIKCLPNELIPYMGIYKSLLGQLNTEKYSYMELNNEINLNSGGIEYSVATIKSLKKHGDFYSLLEIRGRYLKDKTGFAFDIIPEILFKSDYRDKKRVKEVISMLKSRMSDKMISAGHSTAALRALSCFSPSEKFTELLSGISFYDIVKDIEENFDDRFDKLIENIDKVRSIIFRKSNLSFDFTGDRETLDFIKKKGSVFAGSLSDEKIESTGFTFEPVKRSEGIRTASQVQYVAEAGDTYSKRLEYTGALKVLKVIMGYDYLWMNVRVKGGAYGCMSGFTRTGDCYMVSYRDPNVKETLNIFDNAAEYIRNFNASDRDMTKYIIGTIADLDAPLTPKGKGTRSRGAYISGLTYEDIQKERDEILSCNTEEIRSLSSFAECISHSGYVCALGSEEKINGSSDLFDDIRTLS